MATGASLMERITQLARQQSAAEQRMLACMARSPEELANAWTGWRHPTVPVQIRLAHNEFLNAIMTIHDEVRRPVTPRLIDKVLIDLSGEHALQLGGGGRLREWLPAQGDATQYATEVTDLSDERWRTGQRVWTEALYRWYDHDRNLLYVGVSMDLATRQSAHVKKSSWMQFAADATIERYPHRHQSEWAERRAINQEHPLFNRQHNDTPEARERLVSYLIERGRLDLLAPSVSRG